MHLVELAAIQRLGLDVAILNFSLAVIKGHFLSAAEQSISELAIIDAPSYLLIRRRTLLSYRRVSIYN